MPKARPQGPSHLHGACRGLRAAEDVLRIAGRSPAGGAARPQESGSVRGSGRFVSFVGTARQGNRGPDPGDRPLAVLASWMDGARRRIFPAGTVGRGALGPRSGGETGSEKPPNQATAAAP